MIKKFKQKLTKITMISIIVISAFTTNVFAHSGRTDASGGHNKTADGTYHYHSGKDRTIEYPNKAAIAPTPKITPKETVVPKDTIIPKETIVPKEATTPKEITVFVNNEKIEFEQPPILINDRTMIPVRAVVEKLNTVVKWDDKNNIIHVNSKNIEIESKTNYSKNIEVYVNNEIVVFDVQQPVIIKDRTLVPIRNVVEKLNCEVIWNEELKTVHIKTNS